MFSSLAEIKMSQRVSKKGCRRKTSVSGRPTPLFLLSHGSSVPSGLHTTTETPCQQCVQEGDIFSATSGKGGIMLKTLSKLSGLYWPNDQLCSVWRLGDHFNWTCLGAVSASLRKKHHWLVTGWHNLLCLMFFCFISYMIYNSEISRFSLFAHRVF